MPAVKGGGKLQQAILAALNGQPREPRELIAGIVGGRPPTESEYNAAHRAARSLIASGQLRGWLGREPGWGYSVLMLRKVDRWIGDHDGPPKATLLGPVWLLEVAS